MKKIFIIVILSLFLVSCSKDETPCNPDKGVITNVLVFDDYPRRFDGYPVNNKTFVIIYKTECGENKFDQVSYIPFGLPPPPPPIYQIGGTYP
jgi:hypothetical protein